MQLRDMQCSQGLALIRLLVDVQAPVVVLEDVVTSGGSSLKAVERAAEAGFSPRMVLALVDRLEGGQQAITARLPLASLFSAEDFIG